MRGKLRIKVKYIIFIPIIIFVLLPNILFLTGKFMKESEVYFESINKGFKDFSYGILNLYTKYPKVFSPFNGEAYYELSKLKYNISEKRILSNHENGIRFSFLKIDTLENLNDSIELCKKGLEDKDSDYFSRNAINLINLYLEKGDLESAKNISESLIKEEEFKIKIAGEVGRLYLFHITNNKDKAIEYGKELSIKYDDEIFNDFNYDVINGYYRDINYLNGDYGTPKIDNDRKYISKTLNEVNLVYKSIYIDEENTEGKVFDVKNKEDYYNGKNKLKGKLTHNGEPLKYRPVILGDIDDISARSSSMSPYVVGSNYVMGNIEINSNFVTYTDEEGNYEFLNIPNLKREVTIFTVVPKYSSTNVNPYSMANKEILLESNKENIFDIELNDSISFKNPGVHELEGDKFLIEFDKVENADGYFVYLDYSGAYGTNDKSLIGTGLSNYYFVNENKLRIYLKDGALISQMYKNPRSDDRGDYIYLDNVGLIKEGEIIVTVEALDKNGNRINSTNKFFYRNDDMGLILYGKEKELNEGEKLFLDRKFDEGIKWFYDKIKEEGIKREYLYPLIYLSINEDFISKEDGKKLVNELYKINKEKSEFDYFNELLDEKA